MPTRPIFNRSNTTRSPTWFPMVDDAALPGLADDIMANGVHDPIVSDEDIQEGRNRHAACLSLALSDRYSASRSIATAWASRSPTYLQEPFSPSSRLRASRP